MKMTPKEMIEKLTKAHTVKVPGAALILLAETLRSHQAVLMTSVDMAKEAGIDEERINSLKQEIIVNETLGCMALDMIGEAFGDEFLDNYIDGKIDISAKMQSEVSSTLKKMRSKDDILH